MDFLTKYREEIIFVNGVLSFILSGALLVLSYSYEVVVSTIIFSVILGMALIPFIGNTFRLLSKIRKKERITPDESIQNSSLHNLLLNRKIIVTFGTIGVVFQIVFIALSVISGRLILVVFWSLMLGITLFSYLYFYLEIKRRKAKANEAGGNA